MKKDFSKHWKSSKQPRKQRKYIAKAPLHIRKKFVRVNLSKELRKKYGKRNFGVKKGDVVKIMRGRFKKKRGKVAVVNLKNQKIAIDGIQIKKQDGSKVSVPLKASNLQIIELNLDDKKRLKAINRGADKEKQEVKETEKKIKERK